MRDTACSSGDPLTGVAPSDEALGVSPPRLLPDPSHRGPRQGASVHHAFSSGRSRLRFSPVERTLQRGRPPRRLLRVGWQKGHLPSGPHGGREARWRGKQVVTPAVLPDLVSHNESSILKKNQLFGIEVVAAAQVLRLPSLLQDPRDRAWVPASSVSVAPSSPRWGRQREQQWERRDQEAVQSPTLRHKGVRCELIRGFSCFLFPSLKNTLNETRTQIHTASVPLPTYQLPTCLAISLSICLCILQLGKPRPNTS